MSLGLGNTNNLQDSQSILALLQQINLYKNILAQVSYQNQILGRNLNQPNSNVSSGTTQANNKSGK